MIARYKNYFCNIDMSQTSINIWAYRPLNGFEKGITRKGNVYYEKMLTSLKSMRYLNRDFQ